MRAGTVRWVGVGVVALLVLGIVTVTRVQSAPTVTTDKPDYFTEETVIVSGGGFAGSTNYDVPIIRPNGSIVKGSGEPFTPGWDTVLSDSSGDFTYNYKLDGVQGLYEVRVYASPWSGDRN